MLFCFQFTFSISCNGVSTCTARGMLWYSKVVDNLDVHRTIKLARLGGKARSMCIDERTDTDSSWEVACNSGSAREKSFNSSLTL